MTITVGAMIDEAGPDLSVRIQAAANVASIISQDPQVAVAVAIPVRVPVPTGRLARGVDVRIAWADGHASEHFIAGADGDEPAWFDSLDDLAPATASAVAAWLADVDSARMAR